MKIINNKLFKPFILFFISFLLIELIFRLCMDINIIDYSSVRIIIAIIAISLLLAVILSLFNKKINKILIITIVALFDLYALIQAGFNNYLGSYMSFSTTSQVKAVSSFIFDYIKSFKVQYWLILLPIVLLTIYYIFFDKKTNSDDLKYNEKKFNNDMRFLFILLVIMNSVLYYQSLSIRFMQNNMQLIKNDKLFKNPIISNIAINQFGLGIYAGLDIKSIFTNNTVEMVSYNNDNNSLIDPQLARIIDDTDWKALNKVEKDDIYKKLNTYFMSKNISPKNDYTGIFKNKNLIVIMIESGSNVLTDYPEYFPNIAKLYNEGWSWTNAFSPKNACATGNNEMMGILSLYAINQECTANAYKDNTYYEAMFNLFNEANYYTAAYHDYTEQYYERKTYLPNMGSRKYYNIDDLGLTLLGDGEQPWPSDIEFFEKAIPDFITEDKFMVWLTTVSSHMKYNISSETGNMYLDLFKKENWSIDAKRYMSKLKIVDNAMGVLLDELEKNNKLDDTVIVLYADHEPYGLPNDKFSEIAKYDITDYRDDDRTPFIIYNSTLEGKKYPQYTSYINILPTIANLFDLNYDPRLYAGNDLFSNNYHNYVVFSDGSWRSDIAYYNANSSKITYLGKKIYSYEEIQKINNNIQNEIIMDNLAIKNDYFTYLNKKLKKGFVVK